MPAAATPKNVIVTQMITLQNSFPFLELSAVYITL
jgi:hypothetical protein